MCSEWVNEEDEDKGQADRSEHTLFSHTAMPSWFPSPATCLRCLKSLETKYWFAVCCRLDESEGVGHRTVHFQQAALVTLMKCSAGQCLLGRGGWGVVCLNFGCLLRSLESFKNPDVWAPSQEILIKLSWVSVWASGLFHDSSAQTVNNICFFESQGWILSRDWKL